MKNNTIQSKKSFCLLAGYLILYLLLIIILPHFGILKGGIQCISYIALGLCGILLFRKDFLNGFRLWKTHFVRNLIWLIAIFIAGLILENLAAYPAYLLGSEDIGGNTETISVLLQSMPLPFIILSLGVLGPITEEMIYRVILVDRLTRKLPGIVCIILSSLAFGLIHLNSLSAVGLASILPTFVSGLLSAIVYYNTKNITIPVILHVFNNSLAFALMA